MVYSLHPAHNLQTLDYSLGQLTILLQQSSHASPHIASHLGSVQTTASSETSVATIEMTALLVESSNAKQWQPIHHPMTCWAFHHVYLIWWLSPLWVNQWCSLTKNNLVFANHPHSVVFIFGCDKLSYYTFSLWTKLGIIERLPWCPWNALESRSI